MKKLNVNDVITEDPKIILDEQKNFYHYQNLYTSTLAVNTPDRNTEDKFFKSPRLPKLTEEQSKKCNGVLTNSE
jgi:hypothetical protein